MKTQYRAPIQSPLKHKSLEGKKKVLISVTMEKVKKCKKCVNYGTVVYNIKVHSFQ